jgi:hypothetical protein
LPAIIETNGRPASRYVAASRPICPRLFPLNILVRIQDKISQALGKGDSFIREIITQGMVPYVHQAGV